MGFNNATNNLFREQPITNQAASYVVLATDVIINITNTAAPRTVTLPAPSATNVGKFFVVKDTSGGASSNNITVAGASGNIDGAANHVISSNYGSAVFYSDGTNYFTQSELAESAGSLTMATITADPAPALIDTFYLVDTSGGAVTVTLPTAVGISGKSVVIQKNTSDTNTVIVQTTSSQTINGAAPPLYLLNQGDSVTFTSDNTNWQIQSDNRSGITGNKSYMQVGADSQSGNLGVNDPLRYDTTIASNGSDISYNAGTYTFTLKAGFTYKMNASVTRADGSAAVNLELTYQWYDVTGAANLGGSGVVSSFLESSSTAGGGVASAIFTPSVDSDVQVRVLKNAGTITALSSNSGVKGIHAEIEVISGPAPVSQTVEYVQATKTSNQTSVGPGTDVAWEQTIGSIPLATPNFTLKAGKTYYLQTSLNAGGWSGGAGSLGYGWVDSTNTALPFSNEGSTYPTNDATNQAYQTVATAIITPSSNMTVKVRITGGSGTPTLTGGSFATIRQIGSSAQVAPAAPTRTYLPVQFTSSTHNTWQDIGLSIVVPPGTSRLGYNIYGEVSNNSAGSLLTYCKLVDVTGGNVDVSNSERPIAHVGFMTSGSVQGRGNAIFDLRVNPVSSNTYKIQARKISTGGSPNTGINQNIYTNSFIEYRNDEY